MKFSTQLSLWGPFVLASVATWIAQATLWASPAYWVVLSLLGVASGALAVRVLWQGGPNIWAILLVVAGILIGQWWLVELIAAQLLWAWKGFAP